MSMATPPAAPPAPSKVAAVIRVTSGNFLEQFDFFLFGFYAKTISNVFFPSSSEYASLMATFAAFAAGFFMRPLGAIILGAYIDKVGRRKGLIVTLAIMATGTLSIAAAPGYAAIGVAAPLIVVIGRLLQGFSAGAELGGVSVYLAEITTPGRKGFFTSWQSASQQVSIVVASALGFIIGETLSPGQIAAWGWRIPFAIGCGIVPFIFFLRRSLLETDEFLARRSRPSTAAVFRSMWENLGTVLLGMLLVAMTTTTFYLITVYTPTFGQSVLKLSARDSLIVTFFVGISNFIWLPVGGTVSDRFGRAIVLKTATVVTIFTAYPVLVWLASAPSLGRLLMALLWLSLMFGMYNGAMVAALTEVMPVQVRVAGFSLAYSLATALFGGATPNVSTYLVEHLKDRAAPGIWLTFAAACGLVATIALYDSKRGRAARLTPAEPLPAGTEH